MNVPGDRSRGARRLRKTSDSRTGGGRLSDHTEGLTNGRTNGLTNGLTSGLTNGLTNGITNGLVNGNGQTNGIRLSYQQRKVDLGAGGFRRRLIAVGALCAAMLLVPYALVLTFPPEQVEIDGYFLDWMDAQVYTDSPDSDNPDTSIIEYALKYDARASYFYIKVQGEVFRGVDDGADGVYVFVDTDGDPSTGYSVRGLGAEMLALVIGWNHTLVLHDTYFFDHRASHNDYAGFELSGHPAVAFDESRVELGTNVVLTTDSRAVVCARSTTAGEDWSEVNFGADGTAVRIVEEHCSTPVTMGLTDEPMLKLHIEGKGPETTLTGLNLESSGTASFSSITAVESYREIGTADSTSVEFENPLVIREGRTTVIELLATFPEDSAGETFGLALRSEDGLIFDDNVTVVTEHVQSGSMVSYVMTRSGGIVIDGAFADWEVRPPLEDAIGDSVSSSDEGSSGANVDISVVKTASQDERAFFYMSVRGHMLAGSNIPGDIARWAEPVDVGNITNATSMPRTGADFAFVFVDTDYDQETGFYIGGSEVCVLVAGKSNRLISANLFTFVDGEWVNEGPVDAAIDSYQLEIGATLESMGLAADGMYLVTFATQDWRGCEDDMMAFLSTLTPDGVREFGGIIINELYSSQPAVGRDWYELYNTGPDPIDIGGWTMYVDGDLVHTIPEGTILASGAFYYSGFLDFAKGLTFELYDDSDPPVLIDGVTLPLWNARSYGRTGTPADEYSTWVWMTPTPGGINEGQVPIPEFEGVVVPLAIMTIMFIAIRRSRREGRTREGNLEGESDGGHE